MEPAWERGYFGRVFPSKTFKSVPALLMRAFGQAHMPGQLLKWVGLCQKVGGGMQLNGCAFEINIYASNSSITMLQGVNQDVHV